MMNNLVSLIIGIVMCEVRNRIYDFISEQYVNTVYNIVDVHLFVISLKMVMLDSHSDTKCKGISSTNRS